MRAPTAAVLFVSAAQAGWADETAAFLIAGGVRAFWVLMITLLAAGTAQAARPVATTVESSAFQVLIVQPGDTLWAIANKYLKDPARWDEILKNNRLPTKDPTVALPGMTLRVPVRLINVTITSVGSHALNNKPRKINGWRKCWLNFNVGIAI